MVELLAEYLPAVQQLKSKPRSMRLLCKTSRRGALPTGFDRSILRSNGLAVLNCTNASLQTDVS